MGKLTHKGRSVGLIYGFLQILGSVNKMFKPKKIYICWDGKSNAHRREILPSYRMRDHNAHNSIAFDPESFDRQVLVVRRLCKYLGIAQLHDPEQEADDLIYYIRQKHLKDRVTIVSGDKDFNQLVDAKTTIWNPGKNALISLINFEKIFGIQPNQFADFLCLTGDSSDKIPGVRGMGKVRSVKFLKTYGSIENYLGSIDSEDDGKYSEEIRRIYDINKPLIDIPHFFERFEPIKKAPYYKKKYNPKKNAIKYLKVCSDNGINHFATHRYVEDIQNLWQR